jgi:glycosyltransferase involved in cell wall biosynthesis
MFEDDDYAHRVRALGYRVVCAEEVYIHHAGRASFAKLPERTYLDLHDENRRKFEQKWMISWKPHEGDRRQNVYWRDRVDEILAEQPERAGVVVFPPTIGWAIDLIQRPHQLARAFARLGHVVFFCLHDYDAPGGPALERVAPNLYLSSVPFEAFENVRGAQVMVMPYNAWYAAYFPDARVVYEVVDELGVFPGDHAALRRQHEMLLRSADVVVATADRLLADAQELRPDAILNPNGADFEHFANGAGPVPNEVAGIGGPVVGYTGALARWFDYDLVRHAARARPDIRFVLIGPDHDGTLADSRLAELRNVRALGPRPYADLPAYLRGFDVAMIPFTVDDITRSVSPIKLFEYMAAGLPVVTSDLPECRKIGAVFVAESPDAFVRNLDTALARKDDPALVAELKRSALANTWDERARAIVAAVRRLSR